jgi:FKBP-type peptidyl-prolyl cis-trans isomerase
MDRMLNRRWLALCAAAPLCVLLVACTETNADDKGPEKDVKVVTTDSGLKYQDLKAGGGALAAKGKKVSVHYTGWLAKGGKKFDSSVDRNEAFEFDLGAGKVIKGWDEGVAGMKVGGIRKLIIPSELAYGERGAGNGLIPPNAELTFEVELLGIK